MVVKYKNTAIDLSAVAFMRFVVVEKEKNDCRLYVYFKSGDRQFFDAYGKGSARQLRRIFNQFLKKEVN